MWKSMKKKDGKDSTVATHPSWIEKCRGGGAWGLPPVTTGGASTASTGSTPFFRTSNNLPTSNCLSTIRTPASCDSSRTCSAALPGTDCDGNYTKQQVLLLGLAGELKKAHRGTIAAGCSRHCRFTRRMAMPHLGFIKARASFENPVVIISWVHY